MWHTHVCTCNISWTDFSAMCNIHNILKKVKTTFNSRNMQSGKYNVHQGFQAGCQAIKSTGCEDNSAWFYHHKKIFLIKKTSKIVFPAHVNRLLSCLKCKRNLNVHESNWVKTLTTVHACPHFSGEKHWEYWEM